MPGKPEMAEGKYIHRRIVAYLILLILAALVGSIVLANRYQVETFPDKLIIRYDRWSGEASFIRPGEEAWTSYDKK